MGAAVPLSLLLRGHCPTFLVAFLAVGLSLSCPLWQVLAELKEYATEVDVDFVRKAVRAIGRCAIKVEVRATLFRVLMATVARQGITLQHVLDELGVIPPQELVLPRQARAFVVLGIRHSCSTGHVWGVRRAFHPLTLCCWSCCRILACSVLHCRPDCLQLCLVC